MTNEPASEPAIAIIGMAGRFPGAGDVDALWDNLCASVESISFYSEQELRDAGIDPALLQHPNYVRAGGALADVEQFDAPFFGYTPREAEILDPQHRIFLECAWEALERAGCNPATFDGLIGVYAGTNISNYLLFNLASHLELINSLGRFQVQLANDKDHLPMRVSYKLNLRGPSINVNTACSTSLVAVHLACQSLLNGECDLALAGGATVYLPQPGGYVYQAGGILSADGHCRAFDAQSQGFVDGSGVGIVVLRRLEDALAGGDHIHAVIKGSAVNNDGALKVGYTAPSVEGQAAVIQEALAVAGIDPATISYVETHGTGTALGDPIEVAALTQAFRASTEQTGFCALGSVKTNIGHLGPAAGVTGLIKTALALQHAQIPASLHFQTPNPVIDFSTSPFYVNTALRGWPATNAPRRAGVSSFGVGGTNAHVILEQAAPQSAPADPSRPWQLVVLSARTNDALEALTAKMAAYLDLHPERELADIAYTLQVGRYAFKWRRMLICRDTADAAQVLATHAPDRLFTRVQAPQRPAVAFLFPGQGTQYVGMAAELYQHEPIFRAQVDQCAELLAPQLGLDLRGVLYPRDEGRTTDDESEPSSDATGPLDQTAYAQPALFVIEYALAQLWIAWGITPQALIGHSFGEYTAACLSEVLTLEDALTLVVLRGQLTQRLPPGAMLSVPLGESELRPLLGRQLAIAAVNGPALCVVSGPVGAIADFERQLTEQGHECRRLRIAHAFHSALLDPILGRFTEHVRQLTLRPPKIPYISNVSGTWISADEATDPSYWARQLRQTVRFAEGIQVVREGHGVLLEVGPGRTLSTLASQQGQLSDGQLIVTSLRHARDRQSDVALLLTALGKLWLAGVPVDWDAFSADDRRLRLPLPTYPFEHRRYWVEPQHQAQAWAGPVAAAPASTDAEIEPLLVSHQRPQLLNEYVPPNTPIERRIAGIWQELLGIERIGIYDNFFELGGHSLLATRLIARLQTVFPLDLAVRTIFDATTIIEQAEVVEELLLEKIEGLGEDEASTLIAQLFDTEADT
jgi:acyl transferase domain-containing protein